MHIIKNTILSFVIIFSSFSFVTPDSHYFNQNKTNIMSRNSCSLKVRTSSGSAARSVKVTTDVSGGISCIGGKSFYTDPDGYVNLDWSQGCYLKHIFIAGKGYDVDFKNGNSYSITMS